MSPIYSNNLLPWEIRRYQTTIVWLILWFLAEVDGSNFIGICSLSLDCEVNLAMVRSVRKHSIIRVFCFFTKGLKISNSGQVPNFEENLFICEVVFSIVFSIYQSFCKISANHLYSHLWRLESAASAAVIHMSHDDRSLPTGIDIDLEKKYRVSTERRGYLVSYSATYPDYVKVYSPSSQELGSFHPAVYWAENPAPAQVFDI